MLASMISDGLEPRRCSSRNGRFGPASGIPLVSHYVLPMLGAGSDCCFDALAAEVPRWPRGPPCRG